MKCRCFFLTAILLVLLAGAGPRSLGAAAWPTETRPQATFTVNGAGDTPDANPGDGICADIYGNCTLRAAIEEVNARSGGDTIVFADEMYIFLNSPLPAIAKAGTTIDASSVWNTVEDRPGVNLNGLTKSFIGLRLSGSWGNVYGLDIFNCATGISVDSERNMVGGTASGQRNVISGNLANGIAIDGSAAQFNNVQNNWIGLSVSGDTAVPNGHNGIAITAGAANNTIGGSTAAQGNYISGNGYAGVYIGGVGTSGNKLGANTIGLGADDSTRLGNGYQGVEVYNGPQNTWIGGGSLAGNTIVANGLTGITIQDAHWSTIQDNTIRENDPHGVYLQNSGNNQVIANAIAQNVHRGILVDGATAIQNLITANSIHDNGAEGIALTNGGNNHLEAPIIASATPERAEGMACASCMVDLYSDSADEGEVYHGSTTADASGNWVYTGTIAGPNATATNRDAMNNTSEFSVPEPVAACNPVSGVTISGPTTGDVGVPVCFTATVAPGNATEPISYIWTPGPGSGQGTPGVCYTWGTPGEKVITVTASNCGGSAFDTHTVTINGGGCVPVTGVSIAGPRNGVVGMPYTFNATVTPPGASTPITYEWQPMPGSGQGTAGATYTWSAAGNYNLVVAVSNCGGAGAADGDYSITIVEGGLYQVYLPMVVKGH